MAQNFKSQLESIETEMDELFASYEAKKEELYHKKAQLMQSVRNEMKNKYRQYLNKFVRLSVKNNDTEKFDIFGFVKVISVEGIYIEFNFELAMTDSIPFTVLEDFSKGDYDGEFDIAIISKDDFLAKYDEFAEKTRNLFNKMKEV